MHWVQIDRDVVVLYSDEVDGKVLPGRMTVLPVGVFNKLYNQQPPQLSTLNSKL